MRRKEKAISDRAALEAIIHEATVCRLGMVDSDRPYIVPLNFGYRDNVLFFHGALKGRKIDLIEANPQVCFEMEIEVETLEQAEACEWSMRFKSIIGFGRASLVEDLAAKREALAVIMAHYAEAPYTFPDNKVAATAVIRVDIDAMTGKQSGF